MSSESFDINGMNLAKINLMKHGRKMMNAYHNKESLKLETIANAKRHAAQDMLIKGTYGEMNGQFRGCSIGCDAFDITGEVESELPYKITAEYYGFPEWVEHIREHFFENLPEDKSKNWHVDLKKSIPVGLDDAGFNKVKAKFLIFILKRNFERVEKLDISCELKTEVLNAIKKCLSVQNKVAETGRIDESAAWSAANSARSAAISEARSAESAALNVESAEWWSTEL